MDAIINALAAFLGGGAIIGIAKFVERMRKSRAESRDADVDTDIKESQAETNEWKQIVNELRKQLTAAESKMDKIRAALEERVDKIQQEHVKCQMELVACRAAQHEHNERISKLEHST